VAAMHATQIDEPHVYGSNPADLRQARPWHRLAYILRKLPETLEELSRDLDVPRDGRVLDYGCADAPYRRFFPPEAEYLGADLPGNPVADVEIRPDGTVPVEDASCDAVLSTQVLEHVADPSTYLSECARVLRSGGRMLLSTHGIMVYHPDPVDYWRWTGAGLERAVAGAGFEVERLEGIMGLGATGLQLVHDAVVWKLPGLLRAPYSLVMQTLIAIADRLANAESRRMNALVFAVVARKP
jgi:SAM-dependent methyltransferase